MPLTERIAEFVTDTDIKDLPIDVRSLSKEMMLNAAAVGIAGARTSVGATSLEHVQELGEVGECTVLGNRWSANAPAAALVNGCMVHALDFDEIVLRRANHPSNVLLPTVMAVGESVNATGAAVVAAFALGCEVSTKVGAAGDLDQVETQLDQFGWHVESVAGVIGASVATSKLLGLSTLQTQNAIGIAASMASGVQANYGTSTKPLHCGIAASGGVRAGFLARRGFTGNTTAIEHPKGLIACFARGREVASDSFEAALGSPFDIIDPGVGIKPYPCGSAFHTAIDIALWLSQEHRFSPEEISSVTIHWPPPPGDKFMRLEVPTTGLEAKFNVRYVIASALVRGAPTIEHFKDDSVSHPDVVALLPLIQLRNDEPATLGASRPCSMTIELHDGTVLTHHEDHALGHPAKPMTTDQLDRKIAACCAGQLSAERQASVARLMRSLEELPHCKDVFRLLKGDVAEPAA